MDNNTPLCTNCNKNPSSVYIKSYDASGKIEKHLCQECAKNQEKGFNSNTIVNLLDVFQGFLEPNNDHSYEEPRTIHQRNQYGGNKQKSILDNFCIDLTREAMHGKIDPVIGRSTEVTRLIDILNRRTKNNPVLIGEPGVGKTAIIEGLAVQIAKGSVPSKLQNKRIFSLDLTAVTAGTMYRGMFEERMKKIAQEVQRQQDIILFIDEMHVLMGAGSSMDSNMDAANILKPYLTKGNFQIIGATTLEEYREIEKDTALGRRFQTIHVEEPNLKDTFHILKGLKSHYEEHHGISYSDDVLQACVNIADRYIFERHMPDKAIDLMDEVGSKLNLRIVSANDLRKSAIQGLLEDERLTAEANHYEEAMEIKKQRMLLESQLIKGKYQATVEEIKEIAQEITGIPVTDLSDDDKDGLLKLEARLSEKIIGQKHAVEQVVRAVKRHRVNLRKKHKPIVFLFAGPTGVGKTEMTKRLSEELFGDERSMIRYDMSEFMEAHSISKLIGSPPGYIGHDKSGGLTEKVRRRPYSVILLDEFEKAHPDVQHTFLQVYDDGRLTDSHGKTVDFSHTIIIMTSNLGATAPKTTGFTPGTSSQHYLETIHAFFKPEFVNRIDSIIPFEHLKKQDTLQIVDLLLSEIHEGLAERNVLLSLDDSVKEWLVEKGYDEKFGARPLYRTISTHIEDPITDFLIEKEHAPALRFEMDEETNSPVLKSEVLAKI